MKLDPDTLRGRLGYQGTLLGVIALVTSAALALASAATEKDIAAARAADLKQSLAQVLPGQYDNDPTQDTLTVPGPAGETTIYRARRGGEVAAVVFHVSGNGYAGAIDCMMGVDRDGQVLGVRVLNHKETPGLGDKIEPAKDPWIHRFAGKSLATAKWAVKKDGGEFDQFAGATITPRAVVNAVKGGLEFFAQEKARLLADAGNRGREPAPTEAHHD